MGIPITAVCMTSTIRGCCGIPITRSVCITLRDLLSKDPSYWDLSYLVMSLSSVIYIFFCYYFIMWD